MFFENDVLIRCLCDILANDEKYKFSIY